VPELLMVLLGLAQRFLEDNLMLHVEGKAKGTILEVKEEKGIGMTCDIILHDGTLHVGDRIVIAGIDDAIITHVKGILKPPSIKEMRVETRFKGVDSISAAAGVKITAPHLEKVLAGSEFEAVEKEEDLKHFRERVRKEYEQIVIKTDEEGIVVKTDTLGSLEALINELKSTKVSIKKAEVGPVNKRDIIEANANKDELNRAILVFGVKVLPGVEEEASRYEVRLFRGDIIYNIMDDYLNWREDEERQREKQKVEALIKPVKIQLLKDFIFRRSKPAVVGVRVLAGDLKKGVKLLKEDGTPAGTVKSIQKGGDNLSSASEGEEIAVAIESVTIGRQLQGDEVLLIDIPERHAKIIERDLFDTLTDDVQDTFKELVELKRQENPFWGK
ncbi:MAG: translation initiation factor IF-2, partial [Halobacteriota archaeon]